MRARRTKGATMAIRVEDRGVVIAVAVQIFCARLQSADARRPNGEMKHGYSPDLELCVGEAAALVRQVDTHIAPRERQEAIAERRRTRPRPVELTFNSQQ